MDRQRTVPLEKLLQAVALGSTDPDVISSIAVRFSRLEKKLPPEDRAVFQKLADGKSLKALTSDLVQAIDLDRHVERAKKDNPGIVEPTAQQVKQASEKIIKEAVKPLHNPDLRNKILELHRLTEQTIDTVSKDEVTEAAFSADALEKAKGMVTSFEQFIKEHKDEITALQVLYSLPARATSTRAGRRLQFEQIKELANIIERPPYLWRIDKLWDAYAALERSKVRGAGSHRILTDLVSLIRFALHQEDELEPYAEHVQERFNAWLAGQEKAGKKFSEDQMFWLEKIKEHIMGSLSMGREDFDYTPFKEKGGIGKAYQLFGEELWKMLDELNEVLAA
jgi:type I restriction enzyme R subunit